MIFTCDLHVHSALSPDGRCSLTALAAEAKKRGLDAIAVCDHDVSADVTGDYDVLMIPGTEISTAAGHILGLFLEKSCDHASLGAYPAVPDAVREIHRCGGLAVLAHPFAPQKADEAALEGYCVDGVEVCNARSALYRDANERAKKLAARMDVFCTGGSDAHHKGELCGAVTCIEADSCTPAALKAALLQKKAAPRLNAPCKWRYKGLSMLKKNFASHSVSKKCKALCYFALCLVRDFVNCRR